MSFQIFFVTNKNTNTAAFPAGQFLSASVGQRGLQIIDSALAVGVAGDLLNNSLDRSDPPHVGEMP